MRRSWLLASFVAVPLLLALAAGASFCGRAYLLERRIARLESRLARARDQDEVARTAIELLERCGTRGAEILVEYGRREPRAAFDAQSSILVHGDPATGRVLTLTPPDRRDVLGGRPELEAALADALPRTWSCSSLDGPPGRFDGVVFCGRDGDWTTFVLREKDADRYLGIAYRLQGTRVAAKDTYEGLDDAALARLRESPDWPPEWN